MKDIYTLAEEFAALTSEAAENSGTPVVKLAAGRKHRKQLEKDLAYTKDLYHKHRTSLESHEKAHADLSSVIDKERKQVEQYRKDIMRCYDVIRTMDLNDVAEVRFHSNGDVGYVKNNRLFRLDDDGKLTPYKRKATNLNDELEDEPESDLENESYDADDLLNSLL